MPAIAAQHWIRRLLTLALWALCGVSMAWWGLKLSQPRMPAGAPLAGQEALVADTQALSRILGAEAAPARMAGAAAPARFVLSGVLAGTRSGDGAALIAIDGKPAKPYRVGAELEPGLVVQSLGAREVHLGAAVDGDPAMTLELPRLIPLPQ